MHKNKYDQYDKMFIEAMENSTHKKVSAEDKTLFEDAVFNEKKSWKMQEKTTMLQNNSPKQQSSVEHPSYLFQHWLKTHGHLVEKMSHYKVETQNKKHTKIKSSHLEIIDLHGYTRDDALATLKGFLSNLSPQVHKIRIIHGKGLSQGKPSVIRANIRDWLSYQKKYSHWIQDFSYESPQNGGHGATIVWIIKGASYGKEN